MSDTEKLKRAVELLEAAKKLIDGSDMAQVEIVFYDGVDCDGGCLSEDISLLLDEC